MPFSTSLRVIRLDCVPSGAIRTLILLIITLCLGLTAARAADIDLRNDALRVRIGTHGSYAIFDANSTTPVVRAGVAAEVESSSPCSRIPLPWQAPIE